MAQELASNLSKIHFLSDCPSRQYSTNYIYLLHGNEIKSKLEIETAKNEKQGMKEVPQTEPVQ